jgi:hypothetical protein
MANEYFRPESIRFPQEYVVMADIHGNLSALSIVLDDVEQKHRNRIAEALIDTMDPNAIFGKINGLGMRKMLREVLRDRRTDADPKRQELKKRMRDRIFEEVNRVSVHLPKPKKFCLGDILGYYGQSREVLTIVRTFEGVCAGNHDRVIRDTPFSANFRIIMKGTGMGEYSAKSSVAIRNRLNPEDINYLKSLPETIRIRQDTIGRHCHYNNETPMYPISRKVATSEKYFSDESKLGLLCQEPEDIYDMEETYPSGVDFECDAHVHIPLHNQFDENGTMVMDITPGNVQLSNDDGTVRPYFLARYTVPRGHKAKIGVGSVGISRRFDKKIREELKRRGYDTRQAYYEALIERTSEHREVYYDINSKGTLQATIDAGIELRGEDVQDEQ